MSKRKSQGGDVEVSKKPRVVEKEEEGTSEEDMDLTQNADFEVATSEADIGIVERISLRNFMCHNRLDITLGPHVNFIIGRNGSGKSAVVTALVVGLGGKANVTSRGSTIKSFIKTGKQTAEVEIRLRNRGPDAYKPEEYGNSIIVERKFTKDGGSQYKLKSKKGKVISQKREDLNYILDQFNIQVDNPVAILNQETSKSFLNSKSPHDKYRFFLKATQLEQMKMDYNMANEQREITKYIIDKKEQSLPKLEQEVLEWEQKFKSLTAIDDLKKKIKTLKDTMAWAFVIEKEKGLPPLQKDIQTEDNRMPKFIQKVEEEKRKVEECVNRQVEIQDQLKSMNEEVQQLRPMYDEVKKELQEKKQIKRNAQNEVNNIDSNMRKLKNERSLLKDKIKDLQKSAQHDYENERKVREDKIQKLDDQIQNLKAQQQTTEHQLEQFRAAITKYQADEYQQSQEHQTLENKMRKIQKDLQTLADARNNRYKRFGPYMPNLLQYIEEHARRKAFHKTPRGPIGACFQLQDSQWAFAVERCLGNLLHAFCCHDHKDEAVLEKIFDSVCPDRQRPTIIVSAFKDRIYDISKFRVNHPEFPSVYDVLEFQDPVIANCLIDQRGIESVLLIHDNRVAREVMDPDNRPGPPRNCREAFTKEGDQVYSHPSLRYYSTNYSRARYLTANFEEDIDRYQEELHSLTREREAIGQQRGTISTNIQKNKVEADRTNTQLMKIGQKMRVLSVEISDLRSVEDPTPVDVSTLEEEVENLNGQIKNMETQWEVKNATCQQLNRDLESTATEYRQVEQKMRAKAEGADPLKDELGHAQNKIEKAKSDKKHYEQKLKEQEKKISEMKKKLDQYKKEVEEDTKKASQICPERINTRRSVQNLESEINQITKRIKMEEKSRGNPEEITTMYKEKKDAYKKIKHDVFQCRKFIECLELALEKRSVNYGILRNSISWRCKMSFAEQIATSKQQKNMRMVISHNSHSLNLHHLEQVMNHRQQQYSEFRRLIAMRAKYFFIVLLSNRHYTGKMTFNHPKETLEITVQPSTSSNEGAKDMRSLSGGERSFATVCFILALWDAMESPFRCLDEFDVFMDMVNRRISMDLMLKVAEQQGHRQFIFLTPQNMSQLGINVKPHIFSMPDPDRTKNQGVLPYKPVNRQDNDDDEDVD